MTTDYPEWMVDEAIENEHRAERIEKIAAWGEAKRLLGQAQMQHFQHCEPYGPGDHPHPNCGYVQPMQMRVDRLWQEIQEVVI